MISDERWHDILFILWQSGLQKSCNLPTNGKTGWFFTGSAPYNAAWFILGGGEGLQVASCQVQPQSPAPQPFLSQSTPWRLNLFQFIQFDDFSPNSFFYHFHHKSRTILCRNICKCLILIYHEPNLNPISWTAFMIPYNFEQFNKQLHS